MFIEPYYSPDIVLDPGDTMVLMADTPGSPEGNTEGPGTASSEPLLRGRTFPLGLEVGKSWTAPPRKTATEFPAFPGEEY